MPIEWTVSHGARLVIAVIKGEIGPEQAREFFEAIDREGARPYAKMIDVTGFVVHFDPERLREFAALVREREVDGAVGPVAIVGTGAIAQYARAFTERGHLVRPMRVFAEQHEARRWLDHARSKETTPRHGNVPPMKIE